MTDNDNKPMGELSHRVYHNEMMDHEREISDKRYSPAWQGAIVVALCALILTLIITALVASVVKQADGAQTQTVGFSQSSIAK